MSTVADALAALRASRTRGITEDEARMIHNVAASSPENARVIKVAVDEAMMERHVRTLGRQLASPPGGGGSGGSAYNAIQAAGWQLGGPSVQIPFGAVLIPDAGDARPLREPGIVPIVGPAAFRLYPALEQIPLEGATRVDELVSIDRTLADPGDMQLAIDATSEKPVTSSGATLESFDVKMVATVSDAYPNSIVSLPAFRDLVEGDMTTAYRDALDDLVVNTIIDGLHVTNNVGDLDLFVGLRGAITMLQNNGFSPTLAAINPTDAEALDLQRSIEFGTQGPFLLPPSPRSSGFSPLWGLTIRVVRNLPTPIVLDPTAIRLYLDNVRFDADPFSGFTTNETRFRYEGPAVAVVRQPAGVCVVEAS